MRPAPGTHSPRPQPGTLQPCFESARIREAFAHPATARQLLAEGLAKIDGRPWRVTLVDQSAFADLLRFEAAA